MMNGRQDLAFASAAELADALAARKVSSRELHTHLLERVERFNPDLNAIVTLDAKRALAEADAADAAMARGESLGPLHGLPMTVKDSLETAGMRTTSGSLSLADHLPERDAVVVERLRVAGAIIFGKTNLPEFAGDSQTFNEPFGRTNNPWNLERSAGGSSGGAAAAVVAGLSPLELGSDIGGSLRIPAHYCGVFTLKPTFGIVPLKGHVPPPPGALIEPDVLCIGPLAREARDLDLCLSVIAGADAERGTAWRLELPPPRADSLAGYRIAAWLDDSYSTIDSEMLEILHALIGDLRHAGAQIEERAGPVPLAEAHELAQRLIQGAVARWIPDDAFQTLIERAETASPENDTPPVRWARNISQRVRDYHLAVDHRLRLKAAWADFFRDYDAVLCPVMPVTAIPHDENPDVDARTIVVNEGIRSYGDQYAWLQSIGAMHLPAAVAPVGFTAAGLPIGIQIVAPHLEDRTAIDLAARIAEVSGGFRPPPGY